MNAPSLYTVLNVDEVHATRHERTIALRQAGYRVIEAIDQEEAMCLAGQESPALFLPNAEDEERLKILADNAPALIWVDGEDGCQYVNRAYLRFLNASDDQVRGSGWTRFLHPDDRDEYVQTYLDAASRRTLFEAKLRLRRHDGEYRWMKSIGLPRFGTQGEFLGYVGSSVDINDLQLAAEQAAQQSDMVLRLALDAAGMAAWHLNLVTGAVREIGQVWKIFNRPPGFVHMNIESWQEGVHPEDRERANAAFQRAIDECIPFDVEYRTCPDEKGRVRWVQSSGTIVCGEDGKPVSAYGIDRDITDRKRAEEDLRQSRWRAQQHLSELELIYRNVPVGLCVVDREFRFVRMNERLAELNGVPARDHLGRTIREVLPDLAGKLETIWRRVLDTGNPIINVELRGMTPKQPGIERDWIASYVPLRGADGAIYGIGCVVEEITDRKRAEEALRESEARFRVMFDLAATGKSLLDARTGRFMQVNDRFCEISGYSREQLMDMMPADLTLPDDRARDQEGFGQLLRGDVDEYHVEKRYLRPDGTIRWVVVAVRLLRDADRQPWRTMAVIQDVTDRKQAELETARLQHRLSLILNSAGEAVYGVDLEGRATFVNPAGAALFGYQVQELIGQSPHELLHHSYPDGAAFPAADCPIYAAFREGRIYRSDDLVFWKKDGTPVRVSYTSTPIVESGQIVGAVVVLRDITEPKRAEQALQESEERLRRFIQEAPVAIAMFDRDMSYLAVSRRWLTDYRVAGGNILGRSHYEVNPDVPERCRELYRRGLHGETLRQEADRIERTDGSVQWLKWQIQPWWVGSGQIGGIIVFTEDVTARMQAEQALRESEERLRLAQLSANVGVWDWDVQTNRLTWTPELEAIYGLQPGTVRTYDDFRRLVHQEDIAALEAKRDAAIRDHEPFELEFRIIHASGGTRWISSKGRGFYDEDGVLTRVLGNNIDITERKRAEVSLKESEERLRLFIRNAPVAIAMFDRDMKYLAVSQRWLEDYGLKGVDIVGRSHYDVFPEIPERWKELHRRGLRGETSREEADRFERADGSTQWLKWQLHPWRTGAGEVGGLIIFTEDITARMRAEQALRESEERLRFIAEHAGVGFGHWDLVRDEIVWSTTCRRLFGVLDDEPITFARFLAAVHPDDRTRVDGAVRDYLQNGGRTGYDLEYRTQWPDGTVRWIHAKANATFEGGRPVRMAGIALDITERKRTEEALRASEELLRAATDHARVGLVVLDAERRFTFVNPAYRELMGLTGTDMVGRRMEEALGPLYDQTCHCLDRVYAGERISYELTVPGREMEAARCYAVACEPQWGTEGKCVVGVVTVVTDITDRKRAQEDLADIYAFTRQVVDIVPNLIFAKDREGRFTLVNKAVADCYGTTVEELIGRTDADFNPNTDEVAQFLRMDREVMDTGEERKFEEQVTDHSGRVRWMETVKRPIRDERGSVVQVLGSSMEITERKQAEAELKAIAWLLRERTTPFTEPEPQPYGDLTELNADGTILRTVGKDLLLNVTGDAADLLGTSGAIQEKNGDYASGFFASHWCRFLDQASRERCGTTDNRAALASGQWHCHESCREVSARAMERGEPVDMPCKGGIRLYAAPIKVDREIIGCINVGYSDPPKDDGRLAEVAERYGVPLATLRELSDNMPSRPQFIVEVAKARVRSSAVLLGEIIKRKRAEEELRELTEHLEQRIAERTEALVHSQEQLRALATELNLAEQRERKRLAGELHDYLAQMLVLGRLKLGQSKRLTGLVPPCAELIAQADEVVAEALKYTRTLVADLSPPVLYEFGLPAALKWLAEQMQRHDLTVTVDADEVEEIALPENQAVLLFQSVRELLMNAVKHAEAKEATVRLRHGDGELIIEVRDHGKGFHVAAAMPAADKTVSTKFGLFSIRERMKALGGRFDIQSAPGQGTAATLVLPLEARDRRDVRDAQEKHPRPEGVLRSSNLGHRTANAEPVTRSEPRRIRVLLVDDHAMVRQGLRSVLETYADVEVVGEAWDGEEALARVEELRPGVVVMDINMPRLNGVDATAQIKARHPDVIVIGLSVQIGSENQAAMVKAGAAALITKEAAVEELYRAIQRVRGTVV